MTWVVDHLGDLGRVSLRHLWLALVPVAVGLLISLPLGWAAARWRAARAVLVPAAGLLYTIPSLALFVMMPLIIGTQILDPLNVQVALTIYTVALLVRAVSDALTAVPESVTAAATAMGYRGVGRFFAVELPLAVPVLVAGVRVAAVSNISLVSVGALIGVGGLGAFLTEGYQRDNYAEIIAGIVLIVLLALIVDALLAVLGRVLAPWARERA
ncbi:MULTISPECIES: ABC transporter permease [Actinokineospora]|uniref:Osmoprotectant (Glycine betaine/ carnitine/choline/l-proline) ABC transporter ProW n=1 Tax=Actinokineospora fastidiosa TaxID=1816 RepID=A0A918G9E7_9PSEU|nr:MULTISPECIES: ABC transporter permease [Actinokineospora]UVS81691.1 Glycine betaine/carnitine/choline transport system permease protein OpuCB [Actinokineospora sp. UTMC 2448]GGS25929.1 putative osmoprotectant (glycine betaine/ carnitine/choline/l-proline) ABC transporter ProW [Actinokineospora fastidiosa]